jgi:DNA mismatch endonuclease (patch repair protein)
VSVADVFTPAKRSAVMAAIRAKNTKPELAVRRALHAMGLRFRLHVPDLPGRPDIAIVKRKTIIQVKGCFWHGHRCLKGRVPEGNRPYWREKIAGNKARDKRNERRLRRLGWRVRTIWECRVRRSSLDQLAGQLASALALSVARADVRAASGRRAARHRPSHRCAPHDGPLVRGWPSSNAAPKPQPGPPGRAGKHKTLCLAATRGGRGAERRSRVGARLAGDRRRAAGRVTACGDDHAPSNLGGASRGPKRAAADNPSGIIGRSDPYAGQGSGANSRGTRHAGCDHGIS